MNVTMRLRQRKNALAGVAGVAEETEETEEQAGGNNLIRWADSTGKSLDGVQQSGGEVLLRR